MVSAVLDQGLDQRDVLAQAAAGELEGLDQMNPVPGRTTLAGWVQTEATKRARDVNRVIGERPLWEAAERALARYLLPIFEDAELVAQGRPPKLTKPVVQQITANINALKMACPQAGRPPRPTRVPSKRPTEPEPETARAERASALAEQIAARAHNDPSPQTQGTDNQPAPSNTDHQHQDTSRSDSVVGGQAGASAPVPA